MPTPERIAAAEQRVLDGTSWREFCRALEAAGNVLLDTASPMDPFHRAEGLRYLTRLTRAAFESLLENSDPRAPELRRTAHETIKMGADNPDNVYLSAPIHSDYEYRILGRRGTVHYLGIGTQEGGYGSTGALQTVGYLDASDMDIDPDGSLSIAVSVRPQPGNWLPMNANTRMLIVRQTFLDRGGEVAADLRIERTDGPHVPEALTAYGVDRALRQSALFVGGCAQLFHQWAGGFAARPNELPLFDPNVAKMAGGIPDCVYYHGYWQLDPEEALVIDVTPPGCDYWNFQLNNHWMESLDYRYHRIAINKHEAIAEANGSVRVVVAASDPGVDNWLESAGHDRGTMCWRWIRADHHPQPQTRVVPLASVRTLPPAPPQAT